MSQDTSDTVYTVAFGPDGYLMVFNKKRGGWETPGGHVQEGETREEAARREFMEEAGFDIDIRGVYDLGYCRAFAAVIKDPSDHHECEMEHRFFRELPENLTFDREEYNLIIPWAENIIRGCGI